MTCEACGTFVCHKFPTSADCHLDDRGCHRHDDHHRNHDNGIGAVSSATKKHAEVCQHCDRPGKRSSDGTDEHIVVPDVAELMGNDSLYLLLIEKIQQSLSDGDSGMVVVPSRCEGIGYGIRDDINLRHRQISLLGQSLDDSIDT